MRGNSSNIDNASSLINRKTRGGYKQQRKEPQMKITRVVSKVRANSAVVRFYNENDELHNINDEPAVIWPNGTLEWFQHDVLHREGDKPALVLSNGRHEYYQLGRLHRDGDLPAVVYPGKLQEWHKNGQKHRDGGKPAVVYGNGIQEFWENGKMDVEKTNDFKNKHFTSLAKS